MHNHILWAVVLVQWILIFKLVKVIHAVDSPHNHSTGGVIPDLSSGDETRSLLDDEWDIEEDCKCLNGRCEVQCVQERDRVCRRAANVCVCDPEYFKVNDETCIHCGCGQGFNCTFYHTTRTCICPEGFYTRDDKCAATCNERNTCQNGGDCIDGKCKCKDGTSGSFCESPDWCKTTCNQPLLVECVYSKETEDISCLCRNRSLVYDFQQRICKPCPCGAGTCKNDNGTLKCNCDPGYIDFNQKCRPCDCGNGGICEISERGEKTCQCKDGHFSREGKCIPCECGLKDAKCKTNEEGTKACICPYGFEDILGQCIKMNKDDRRCLCHPTANCIETNNEVDEFNCTCNEGYKGKIHDQPQKGEECVDIDECKNSETCPGKENVECVNFEGSYMCRCKIGFQPAGSSTDPRKTACEKYKISWVPTGVVSGIIVCFIAISVGVLLYLRRRSKPVWSSSGMELHQDWAFARQNR